MADLVGFRSRLHQWRRQARPHLQAVGQLDEGQLMLLFVALACLFVSPSIGYAYAGHIWVTGWQLWGWLVTLVTLGVVLLVGSGRPPLTVSRSWRWLALLLPLALLLRVPLLESIPGGLHVDEMGVADFSLRHVFGAGSETVYPFRTGNASHPVLYHYLIRLFLAVIGPSITGLRLSSALAGSLAVLATFAMVTVFQNQRTGLLAAALMVAYHYHVHWSRIGLNNIWDTLWVPLMLAAYAWGWRKGWSGGAVIAGLALGLSQYFYTGSKLGALLLLFVVWRLWREERDNRRLATYAGTVLLVALTAAAPLILFALREPAIFFE